VIESVARMNEDGKVIPILNRVIELFKTMLDQGKASYTKAIIPKITHSKLTIVKIGN
jgi:hypothetical protein